MITTIETADWPPIEWGLGDVLDSDPEERMIVYEAAGTDVEGNNYTGSAYFFAGVFKQMEGVEKL